MELYFKIRVNVKVIVPISPLLKASLRRFRSCLTIQKTLKNMLLWGFIRACLKNIQRSYFRVPVLEHYEKYEQLCTKTYKTGHERLLEA